MSRTHTKELVLMNAALAYAVIARNASTCSRASYSCVLTTIDLTIVSCGYNGVASGLPNECLRADAPGNCGCLHAEWNAVANLRNTSYSGDLVAFITGEPCETCAMLLARVGVKMVVYNQPSHRPYGGCSLLDRLGIPHGDASSMAEQLRFLKQENRLVRSAK